MKKTRKIRNGGCPEYYICELRLLPFLHIRLINSLLWVKRQYRRFARVLKCSKFSLLLLPIWLLFSFFIYWGELYRGQSINYCDVLWDLKTTIFTSVIIAAFTAAITEHSKTKNAYFLQHTIYTSFMYKCSELAKALLVLVADNSKLVSVPFWPFYESKTMEMSCEEFAKVTECDIDSTVADVTRFCLKKVRESLRDVMYDCDNRKIMDIDIKKFTQTINECLEKLDCLERTIFFEKRLNHSDICICSCLDSLFNLIELIRFPWRRDMKYRKKILHIISRENPNMEYSYYDEAILGIVNYDFYALGSDPEKIRQYIKDKWLLNEVTV